MPEDLKNQRKYPRVPVRIQVKIGLSSGESVQATIVDLSPIGAGIEYAAPAEKGAILKLAFQLRIKEGVQECHVQARVVHNYLKRNTYVIGVQFLSISEEAQAILRGYLSHLQSLRVS